MTKLTVRVTELLHLHLEDADDSTKPDHDEFFYVTEIPENLPTSIVVLIAKGLLFDAGWCEGIDAEIYLNEMLFLAIP